MAGPLSMDLRIRGLAAVADGASGRRVGDRFGVSAASVASVGAHAGRRVAKGGGRRPSFAEDRKPMVLDGPINGRAFQAYIDQLLVPELKPGDGVIMGQPLRADRIEKLQLAEGAPVNRPGFAGGRFV